MRSSERAPSPFRSRTSSPRVQTMRTQATTRREPDRPGPEHGRPSIPGAGRSAAWRRSRPRGSSSRQPASPSGTASLPDPHGELAERRAVRATDVDLDTLPLISWPCRLGTGPMGNRSATPRADGGPGTPRAGHREQTATTRPTARWRSSSRDGRTHGRRTFEVEQPAAPAFLTVDYTPHKSTQEFLACAAPGGRGRPGAGGGVLQAPSRTTSATWRSSVAWPTPARAS